MKNKKISALLTVALLASSVSQAFAAAISFPSTTGTTPSVTIKNNYVGTPDVITIKANKFTNGDVINVYKKSTDTTTIGAITINDATVDNTLSINELGLGSGMVYLTRTPLTTASSVSVKTSVTYTASKTAAPATIPALNISAVSNVAIQDTVTFTPQQVGDVLAVYNGTTKIGASLPVTTTGSPVTFKLNAHMDTVNPSNVKVTLKTGVALESDKSPLSYTKANVSNQPTVEFKNNPDSGQVVVFKNLPNKAVAKIYKAELSTRGAVALASSTVTTTASAVDLTVKMPVSAMVPTTTSGAFYVTVTEYNKLESAPVLVNTDPATQTPDRAGLDKDVIVINNVDSMSTVTFKNLSNKSIATLYYKDAKGVEKSVKATATIPAKSTASAIDVTINLPAGTLATAGGSISVTVKNYDSLVSNKQIINYNAAAATTELNAANILYTNNSIYLTKLSPKDIVTVYNADPTGKTAQQIRDGKLVIATKTVAAADTYAFLNFTKLASGKTIYVTNRSYNKLTTSVMTITIP